MHHGIPEDMFSTFTDTNENHMHVLHCMCHYLCMIKRCQGLLLIYIPATKNNGYNMDILFNNTISYGRYRDEAVYIHSASMAIFHELTLRRGYHNHALRQVAYLLNTDAIIILLCCSKCFLYSQFVM